MKSFKEFWPYYVGEHKESNTRRWHFAGTSLVILVLLLAITTKPWLASLIPILGYGPAWFSHFFIEKNRPATFSYPLWSLMADFKMWWLMVSGQMSAEVERCLNIDKK